MLSLPVCEQRMHPELFRSSLIPFNNVFPPPASLEAEAREGLRAYGLDRTAGPRLVWAL